MKLNGKCAARLVLCGLVTLSWPSAAAASVPCESLADLALPDTTITAAAMVPAGTFDPPGAIPPIDTTACRVAGSIKPTGDSDILFEVWMPAAGWNRKFLSAGEGGYAGAINYGGIADALRRGYAGGSTDTGHVGGTADFAPGHPEKVVDFGWRAKHLQAVRSKDIIRAFYGTRIRHSYFSSCSNGGRQALMEIQRFPEDYDGLLVGAPAHDWTHLMAGFVWNEQALWNAPGAYPSAGKLAAVEAATLATCDGIDGVMDGVVEDPRLCAFDPASLACPPDTDGEGCLTPGQISAVKAIMAGPRNPRTGDRIFPGYFTSAAGQAAGWPVWITGPAAPGASVQAFFGNGFFGRMIEEIPAPGVWDFSTFDFDGDMAAVDAKGESALNATDPELSAFTRHKRRAKIIIAPQAPRKDHHVARLGGPGDLGPERGRVRPAGGPRKRGRPRFLPPLHGARHAALRRWARTERIRSVPPTGAAAQQCAGARYSQRPGAMGRGRGPAHPHRGREVHRRSAGPGDRAHAPALPVSQDRGLQGQRQHRRCGELRMPPPAPSMRRR